MKNKILVVGDLMLDHYIYGSVSRISPEAPVPVLLKEKDKYVLGGAGNVSLNLARLGCQVDLLSIVGKDEAGNQIKYLLEEVNINDLSIYEASHTTTVKTRVMCGLHQIVRIDNEKKCKANKNIEKRLKEIDLKTYSVIIISDYGKGYCSEDICQYIIKQHQHVLVDPKGKDWNKYKNAFLVTPNLSELMEVGGVVIDNQEKKIEKLGKRLMHKFKMHNLLITRSEEGMTLLNEHNITTFRTEAKEVFDVSGAGDTVIATLGFLLSKKINLLDAVPIANKAAGFVIGKLGTYPISIKELSQISNF